jgi:hypothetical protein
MKSRPLAGEIERGLNSGILRHVAHERHFDAIALAFTANSWRKTTFCG